MYTIQPCTSLQRHFMQRVHVCSAVTYHLHFWQNNRDLLRATAVTRGWNGYRNKSQHRPSPWKRTFSRTETASLGILLGSAAMSTLAKSLIVPCTAVSTKTIVMHDPSFVYTAIPLSGILVKKDTVRILRKFPINVLRS